MTTPAIWFRLNDGEWNGDPSADPATQTGGFDISSITAPYIPFLSGSNGFGGEFVLTANFGASAFAYTAPSGSVVLGAGITWSPTDNLDMGLSDGNLRAGVGSETNAWARATQGANGNLQYFELTGTALNYGQLFAGVASSTASISTGGSPGAGDGTISYSGQGGAAQIVIGGDDVLVTGLDAFATSDVLGIAIYTDATPTPPTPTPTPPPIVVPPSLGLWRGQTGINWNGLALVGDAFTNVVGLSNFEIFNEYGNQIQMLATTPPIHKDRKRISIPRFELEVEAGLGTPGVPEQPPLCILDYSKDGGITWSTLQVFRSMGAVGEYIKRIRWINLGNSRTWVFRIQYASAARPSFIGTYYDFFENLG